MSFVTAIIILDTLVFAVAVVGVIMAGKALRDARCAAAEARSHADNAKSLACEARQHADAARARLSECRRALRPKEPA